MRLARPLIVAVLLLGSLAGCSSSTPVARAVVSRSPVAPTAAPTAAPATSPAPAAKTVHKDLADLPRPSSAADIFSPPIFTGSSSLGDLGSVSWNIHQRGGSRPWAAYLYVYPSVVDARIAIQRSPAVPRLCSASRATLTGFSRPGATTLAVACQGNESRPLSWALFEEALGRIHLVVGVNAARRSSAVAAMRPILTALFPVVGRAAQAVKDLQPNSS
ncbi:MAG: hypothetical protein QOE99_1764 [Actinomycetota bacterium]|jgi:hypothetical protein|nr:hypothetical protein [Actinomycetota bacterium]